MSHDYLIELKAIDARGVELRNEILELEMKIRELEKETYSLDVERERCVTNFNNSRLEEDGFN